MVGIKQMNRFGLKILETYYSNYHMLVQYWKSINLQSWVPASSGKLTVCWEYSWQNPYWIICIWCFVSIYLSQAIPASFTGILNHQTSFLIATLKLGYACFPSLNFLGKNSNLHSFGSRWFPPTASSHYPLAVLKMFSHLLHVFLFSICSFICLSVFFIVYLLCILSFFL